MRLVYRVRESTTSRVAPAQPRAGAAWPRGAGVAASPQRDASGAGRVDRFLEYVEPRIHHIENPVLLERLQRGQAAVRHHRGDHRAVTTEDERLQRPRRRREDAHRVLRGGLVGHIHLTRTTSGEPLLRPPAGRTASVHLAAPDLALKEFATLEDAGGVAAETAQQYADAPVAESMDYEADRVSGPKWRKSRFDQRGSCVGTCQEEAASHRPGHGVGVAGVETVDPPGEPLRRDVNRPGTTWRRTRGHPAILPVLALLRFGCQRFPYSRVVRAQR